MKEIEQKKEEVKEKTEEKTPDEKEKAKVKKQIDDEDDSIGIKEPIDVDNTSASKLMEITIVMQSRAQKKRLKEQRKEAKTIQIVVENLSSLLPETDIGNLSTPTSKLGQLVADASD